MEIIPINEDKIKISLTRQDLDKLGLSYAEMDYADKKTKSALLYLLQKAKEETGFSPRGAKLFIEVYQDGGDGCVLYFTGIRKPSRLADNTSAIAPSVFEFDSADDLIVGACKVFERYSHRIYKSSLYLFKGRYRLLIYNLDYSDKLSIHFLSEFGKRLGDDEIFAAYTMEHGKELLEDSALDTLSRYFK